MERTQRLRKAQAEDQGTDHAWAEWPKCGDIFFSDTRDAMTRFLSRRDIPQQGPAGVVALVSRKLINTICLSLCHFE